MRAAWRWALASWAMGCAPEAGPATPVDPADDDVVVDTEPPDDPTDMPTPDTDTDVEAPAGVPALGAGFVDCTPAEVAANWPLPEFDARVGSYSRVGAGTFAQLDDDAAWEVVLSGTRVRSLPLEDGSASVPMQETILVYDPVGPCAYAPFAPLPSLVRTPVSEGLAPSLPPSIAANDLDGDGIDELLVQEGDGLALFTRTTEGWRKVRGAVTLPAACAGQVRLAADAVTFPDLDDDGRKDVVVGVAYEDGVTPTPACTFGPAAVFLQVHHLVFDIAPVAPLRDGASRILSGFAMLWPDPGGPSVICPVGSETVDHSGSAAPACFQSVPGRLVGTAAFTMRTPMGIGSGGGTPMGVEVTYPYADAASCPVVAWSGDDVNAFTTCLPGSGTPTDAATPWFDVSRVSGLVSEDLDPSPLERAALTPWGVEGTLDLDQDGCQDLVVVYSPDAGDFNDRRPPRWGHPVAWWNEGCRHGAAWYRAWPDLGLGALAGRHVVVDRSVLVDPKADDITHREHSDVGLVCGDLDGDGDSDCVTTGHHNEPPRVLINQADTGHHGLTIALAATVSSDLGSEIRVEVPDTALDDDDAPQVIRCSVNAGVSGHAVGPGSCGFGLAEHTSAKVRVHWRSGFVHEVGSFDAGARHVITEPRLLSLSPEDGVITPDGVAQAVLTACPFLANGVTVDPEGWVSVTGTNLGGIAATIGAPQRRQDGCWDVPLTAGTSPSATMTLTVTLHYADGSALALGTHPRVRSWIRARQPALVSPYSVPGPGIP